MQYLIAGSPQISKKGTEIYPLPWICVCMGFYKILLWNMRVWKK
jgi:hypothetical protein